MSTPTNNGTSQQPQPSRLRYEDAKMIWVAREVLRVRAALWGMLLFFFLLEFLPAVHYGDYGRVLILIGVQLTIVLAVRWGCLAAARRVRRWWCQLALVLVLGGLRWWCQLALVLVLGGLLTGCQAYGTAIARMYGYTGDPFPGPCAPESLQAGYCIPLTQEGVKP